MKPLIVRASTFIVFPQVSVDHATSASMAKARSARRQRKLDQIEIPEENVVITDEMLGKGGFGEVYLADYNGRNAAAKVIFHELLAHDSFNEP